MKKYLCLMLLASAILLSCKKDTAPYSGGNQTHIYTSTETVDVYVGDTIYLKHNAPYKWTVICTDSLLPKIIMDSVVMTGTFTYNIYDSTSFKHTEVLNNVILGHTIIDSLADTFIKPVVNHAIFEPVDYTATGTTFYNIDYH